jgi:hypothetical protein
VDRNRRRMSGVPVVLSASRNGSGACRYEIRPVFSTVPAITWPRRLVVGYFTAETRVRSQTSHFGCVEGELVMGQAFLPQILAAHSLTFFN